MTTLRPTAAAVTLVLFTACTGNFIDRILGSDGEADTTGNPNNGMATPSPSPSPSLDSNVASESTSFDPLPQRMSVAKIKTLLTNAPPTADELNQVAKNPYALRSLISAWMQTPAYLSNRRLFFVQAFQQRPNITTAEKFLSVGPHGQTTANLGEGFARTVEQAVDSGQPFNSVVKTSTFMMTVPMMVYYAMYDTLDITSNNSYVSNLTANFVLESDLGPISSADTLNPASSKHLMFYDANVRKVNNPDVCLDPNGRFVMGSSNTPANGRGQNKTFTLYAYFAGGGYSSFGPNGVRCNFPGPGVSIFTDEDYSTWKMVTIRQPNPGESTTLFYDLPTIRSTNTLVLKIPRIGYFTTPAFFAQWDTNSSNQARSTINQTMIVGLNHSFDGSTLATPGMDLSALEPDHAIPGTSCYGCHQTLDPMRQIFLKELGDGGYTPQTSASLRAKSGWFDYDGVSEQVPSLVGLGQTIANHPDFALAWAEKLCNYANSSPCVSTDPELLRIAQVFKESNFSWNALVLEMFSSPIVTYSAPTVTATTVGETVTILRQEQLCGNLSVRLNVPDICGLESSASSQLAGVHAIAEGLPSNNYSRGATVLPLVVQPGLIYRSSMENMCSQLATYLIDNGTTSRYSSHNPTAAIEDFALTIMGMASGTEAPVVAKLQAHYNAALVTKTTATVALQSTFMLACLSPPAVALGVGL